MCTPRYCVPFNMLYKHTQVVGQTSIQRCKHMYAQLFLVQTTVYERMLKFTYSLSHMYTCHIHLMHTHFIRLKMGQISTRDTTTALPDINAEYLSGDEAGVSSGIFSLESESDLEKGARLYLGSQVRTCFVKGTLFSFDHIGRYPLPVLKHRHLLRCT